VSEAPDDPRLLKAAYLQGSIEPLLPPGVRRVAPPCPAFDVCGGCQLQHVSYEDQLAFKRNLVARAMAAAGLPAGLVPEPVRGMPGEPLRYRNKADFSARTWDDELHIGFRPHGGRGALVEVAACPILLPVVNATLTAVRGALPAFPDLRRRLVSVVVRASLARDQAALFFHSKLKDDVVHLDLATAAQEREARILGGTYVRKRKAHTVGEASLEEEVGGLRLTYPVRSFFQANPGHLPELCRLVAELAEHPRRAVLVDVFCGVGLFALTLARRFENVFGIESTPYSVTAAQQNALANGVTNVTFLRGTAEERVHHLCITGFRPDVIVLDPPRSGLGASVVQSLAGLRPSPVVVLVSCNPVTLATDLVALARAGYAVERVVPVDMFPQTEHVEVVARLTRAP
jgi:tRNA/tmRNA/rRNA uracil-C5-methylase (TrmA/RlmC/RlmD family)